MGQIKPSQKDNFNFVYQSDNDNPIGDLKPEDNTPPKIIINNPIENGHYFHSDNLKINYIATDDFSGVDTISLKIDNKPISSSTIDLFYYDLGNHILNITALDKAGNSASAEVKFRVITNINSTIKDVEKIYSLNWIKKKHIKQSLILSLKILQFRLNIFIKQKNILNKIKEKIENNTHLRNKVKQRIIKRINKRLKNINKERNRFINKFLNKLDKKLKKEHHHNFISQSGYNIINNDINYLRKNL